MADEIKRDLFGNPVEPLRDRRGRPSFKKTPENQQFVALRAAAGWTQDAIAADMGIDPKTLRKNFSRELELGALIIEGQRLDVLAQKMREGNVSATRALDEIIEKGQRRRDARRFKDPDAEAQEPQQPEGKKQRALRAAQEAIEGDDNPLWGDDLKPGFRLDS